MPDEKLDPVRMDVVHLGDTPTPTTESATLSAIERMVKDPGVDISKLEALLRMQREFEDRQAERAFNVAMANCQEEIDPIWRNKKSPEITYRYADLEFVDTKVRPIISKHGFALTFDNPELKDKDVTVTCTVLHRAGHSKNYSLSGQLDVMGPKGGATKTAIQGLGSTVSYLRRYLIAMIFNLVFKNEDTDGVPKGFLDEAQVSAILDMFTACQMDQAGQVKFLEFMSKKAGATLKTLGEIPKRYYAEAMTALNDKLRQIREGR